MADPIPDLLRKALKEFNEADALLSSEPGRIEAETASRLDAATNKEAGAKQMLAGYRRQIDGERVSSSDIPSVQLSPQIDGEVAKLKNHCDEIVKRRREIEQNRRRLKSLECDFAEALDKERKEREELARRRERELAETLAKEKQKRELHARRRRNRLIGSIAAVVTVACVLFVLHTWLMRSTTLSFGITLDGKPLSADQTPSITVDGKPFASGKKIVPGHHHLSVGLQDVEPAQRTFWTFYGSNSLGMIPLTSFKGSLYLASEPSDADYELTGDEQHWQGSLPAQIDAVPVGTYKLAVSRKGWQLDQELMVNRGKVTTNKTEFPYGSIVVTSAPAGLELSVNGTDTGKTPSMLRELRPGQYRLSITDGENDLTDDVSVGSNQAVKKSFVFHYGTARLSSSPPGATVIRNGKDIGKTPLTLEHIAAGSDVELDFRLDGFAPTNLIFTAQADMEADYIVKMYSTRYLTAMNRAENAIYANQFDQASNLVAAALQFEPNDPAAMALATTIAKKSEELRQRQLAAERLAAQERERQRAAEFATLPVLDTEAIIRDCWNTQAEPLPANSYDKVGVAALPAYAATEVVVGGINIVAAPFKLFAKKQPRFVQARFKSNYQNQTYRYFGDIAEIDEKNNKIVFVANSPSDRGESTHMSKGTLTIPTGNISKLSCTVIANCKGGIPSLDYPLRPGTNIWISGQLFLLDQGGSGTSAANHLVLTNCQIYPADILTHIK